jgi:phenylalanyl-tRNA synthetase beta chain
MKFSESWLRTWVNTQVSRKELCEKLTMAGLEVESVTPVATEFSGVIVGEVLSVAKHPKADRLQVCEVEVGNSRPLTIVCGAKNVAAQMKVPVAIENAVLADGLKIRVTSLRGVTSEGMLCSASELGLADDTDGLFALPKTAPIGASVWEYLKLADYLIEVAITPNRGDCLSILGLAKEVAAITESALTIPAIPIIKPTLQDSLPITNSTEEDCPQYVGRLLRNVNASAATPIWLREHLRRNGIRSISAMVDITNFVMLELGQPMHVFSLEKISERIHIRKAKAGERIKLLDESEVQLDAETVIIADNEKPLAIAGVMGGLDSAVTLATQNVFLESAFFKATTIAKASRRYNLSSDSAYRFERGIDPTLQQQASERATQLILEICGGEAGPVISISANTFLPQEKNILLRKARIKKILGCDFDEATIVNILNRLDFSCKKNSDGWQVTVPARRSDITIEIDLIEEIARLYGYDKMPCLHLTAALQMNPLSENKLSLQALRHVLCDQGYHEVVTYSFIDKKLQALFAPEHTPKELLNPITADMSVMRSTLWPGLVNTLLYNQNRQQERVRIFETGLRFIPQKEGFIQSNTLSGLINGTAMPRQWAYPLRLVDFFDMKGDLQNLFKQTLAYDEFVFNTANHPALHPGQTAAIYREGKYVGIFGLLHPNIIQSLKIESSVFVFELELDSLEMARVPAFSGVSKFPEIRRDIAILLDRSVPTQDIQYTIKQEAGALLKELDIFDVYQGKGIRAGAKSIALALTLQHSSRTLIDEEVADLMERIIVALKGRFNAELRG